MKKTSRVAVGASVVALVMAGAVAVASGLGMAKSEPQVTGAVTFNASAESVTAQTKPLLPRFGVREVDVQRAIHIGTVEGISHYLTPSTAAGDVCLVSVIDAETAGGTCNRLEAVAKVGLWSRFSDARLGVNQEWLVVVKPDQLPGAAALTGPVVRVSESGRLIAAVVPEVERVDVTLTGVGRSSVTFETACFRLPETVGGPS